MKFHIQKKSQPTAVSTSANHGLKIPREHQQTHTPHPSLSSEECRQNCSPSREMSDQRRQNSRRPTARKEAWKSAQRFSTEERFHHQFKSCLLVRNLRMPVKYEHFKRNLYSTSSSKIEENVGPISEAVYIRSSQLTRGNRCCFRHPLSGY